MRNSMNRSRFGRSGVSAQISIGRLTICRSTITTRTWRKASSKRFYRFRPTLSVRNSHRRGCRWGITRRTASKGSSMRVRVGISTSAGPEAGTSNSSILGKQGGAAGPGQKKKKVGNPQIFLATGILMHWKLLKFKEAVRSSCLQRQFLSTNHELASAKTSI